MPRCRVAGWRRNSNLKCREDSAHQRATSCHQRAASLLAQTNPQLIGGRAEPVMC